MKFNPVIKWTGSKRTQSETIVDYFPKEIDTYFEPFIGGGSVLFQLLHSDVKVKRYVCSDINKELIALWNDIKDNPEKIIEDYTNMWNELNCDINLERKKEYFNSVRERFNQFRSPSDLIFLSRTTVNGLIRYNKNGEFNNSFHVTRNGIIPKSFSKIVYQWSEVLKSHDVRFIHCNFSAIKPNDKDYMYLDPPYTGCNDDYHKIKDYSKLWDWLRESNCGFSLSFDGICGKQDRTYQIPEDIYTDHKYIKSGCSGFKKLEQGIVQYVKESLYIRRN